MFKTQHENYRELIWMLAKTDFKLRYQGSVLGYIWALLSPLLLFTVLNFVFSSIFARGAGIENYALQLLVSLVMFFFFQEGTSAGMKALRAKSQLVTKIYVPRWTMILASTVNSAMIFLMNLVVIVLFFGLYKFIPSIESVLLFLFFSMMIYVIIVAFSFLAAPLFIYFRDLSMIWDVVLRVMFYATPIIYPLQMLPENLQRIALINPIAFIIHFTKESLINNHFAEFWQYTIFISSVLIFLGISLLVYKRLIPNIAEKI